MVVGAHSVGFHLRHIYIYILHKKASVASWNPLTTNKYCDGSENLQQFIWKTRDLLHKITIKQHLKTPGKILAAN